MHHFRYFDMMQHQILHQKKPLSVLRSLSSKVSSLSRTFTINSIHPFSTHKIYWVIHRPDCANCKNITYPDDFSYCASFYFVREAFPISPPSNRH
ncbi:hypothetical protein AVEN_90965-1 [Araneus ventricosus]|uniref:Uncharacterized protein n=1 Tax=Araneus ventricosus TaxID=182803 RepID=A0A4Y2QSD8_ARAVE|nr:hypothetical protein AVEN_90965-1 [Araneus ventricosus]